MFVLCFKHKVRFPNNAYLTTLPPSLFFFQKLTPSFERTTPEGRYPNDFSIDSLLQRSSSLAQLTCEGGDLAVVDGRVLQRMRGNRGQERRYMVVFDFCRWWFRLHPQEGQGRSLFEE